MSRVVLDLLLDLKISEKLQESEYFQGDPW
jgi:hypothetical protein